MRPAPRRGTRWVDNNISEQVIAGAQGDHSLLQSIPAADTYGWTVVRMLADIYMYPVSPSSVTGLMCLDFGIGIIEVDAVVASVFPDPISEADEPGRGWMWRARRLVSDGVPITFPFTEVHFDLRSRRKIDRAGIQLIFDSTTVQGSSFTVEIMALIRLLVLMP